MPEFDNDLILNGDNRNVIDKYKNWTVSAIKKDLVNNSFGYHVAIENYQHDFNIGSIVRNANAFNASGVHIVGKRHWNRRGAMSTEKYLELYNHKDINDLVAFAKDNNLAIIGVDNIKNSVNLSSFTLPRNCLLVFGQEGPGLSITMQQYCQNIVAIEQFGSTRSVNVGVASGIIMYEWVKTWQLAG